MPGEHLVDVHAGGAMDLEAGLELALHVDHVAEAQHLHAIPRHAVHAPSSRCISA